MTCTRALRHAKESKTGAAHNFFNYTYSILNLMLWVLPINLPVLVVWVHNMAVHWLTPFSSHHNVLSIMPFILLVETLSSGMMVPALRSFRWATNLLFFALAVYAALYGMTYAYRLHYIANIIALWLVVLHFPPTRDVYMSRALSLQVFRSQVRSRWKKEVWVKGTPYNVISYR